MQSILDYFTGTRHSNKRQDNLSEAYAHRYYDIHHTWNYDTHPHTFLDNFTTFRDLLYDYTDESLKKSSVQQKKRFNSIRKSACNPLSFRKIQYIREHPECAKNVFVIEPQDYMSIAPLSEVELDDFYNYKGDAVTGSSSDRWFHINDRMIRIFSKPCTIKFSENESVTSRLCKLSNYVQTRTIKKTVSPPRKSTRKNTAKKSAKKSAKKTVQKKH